LSPGHILVDAYREIPAPSPWLYAAGISLFSCGTVFLLSRRVGAGTQRVSLSGFFLCLLIAAYYVPEIATLILYRDNHPLFSHSASLITAISCGILCAILCGTATRAGILVCLFGLFQGIYTILYHKFGINDLTSGDVLRAGGTFDHPNGVYTLMMIGLPIAVALGMSVSNPRLRALLLLSGSVMFSALLLTWFRGGVLGVAVGLSWLVWRLLPRRSAVAAITCLALVFLFVAQHRVSGVVNQSSSQRSIAGRQRLWTQGLVMFRNNWLLGMGVGVLTLPERSESAVPGQNVIADGYLVEPKNQLLHWAIELGIAGVALYLLFFAGIYRVLRKRLAPIALGLTGTWIALFVSSLCDTPFGTCDRYYGNVLLGLLIAMTIILTVETPPSLPSDDGKPGEMQEGIAG